MMNMYHTALTDHYRNPRNRGQLKRPDFASKSANPSCGDSIAMQGQVRDGQVTLLAFTGEGCVISQATASLLTQECSGKSVTVVLSFEKDAVLKLIGMQLGPTRLRCALLPLEALQSGLQNYARQN